MKAISSFWHLRNLKFRAFTLLECLVALLVLAGAIQVYQSLTQVISSRIHYLSSNQQQDWLLFSQQLTKELEETRLDKVDNGKLYVQKGDQALAFGLSKAGDFRKTNADGKGYQPMLFNVKSADISQSKNLVTLHLTFEDGLERSLIYAFEATR